MPLCLLKESTIINCWVSWTSKQKNKLCSCVCLLYPLLQKTRPYCINIVQNTMWNCSADIFRVTDTLNWQKYFIFSSCWSKGAKTCKQLVSPCTACNWWFVLNEVLQSEATLEYTWDFGLEGGNTEVKPCSLHSTDKNFVHVAVISKSLWLSVQCVTPSRGDELIYLGEKSWQLVTAFQRGCIFSLSFIEQFNPH